MKTILTLCAAMLLFVQTPISARAITAPPAEEPVLAPDVMPSFRGDADYFHAWFNNEIVYPKKASKEGNGEVEVSFIIEKNGKLTGIEILKSPDELLSKEVIRALKKSPRWEPGTVNGVPVRVKLTMPMRPLMRGEFLTTDGKKADVAPTFQGGYLREFIEWLMNQVVLPIPAHTASTVRGSTTSGLQTQSNLSDQNVLISWGIDEAGRVTNICIINTTDRLFSDEVARVINRSPQWAPGLIDGKPVSVVLTVPITMRSYITQRRASAGGF